LALNAPREVVRNIILHEIAHALVYPFRGHGEKWQNKAKELGVTWERKYRK
jgi:predicted SprT family Zn-dependent metalloprotease